MLKDLRVGQAVFDMRLWREGDQTRWEVTRGPAEMVEQRDFARGTAIWPASAEAKAKTTAA
jgi:hypothetical protein